MAYEPTGGSFSALGGVADAPNPQGQGEPQVFAGLGDSWATTFTGPGVLSVLNRYSGSNDALIAEIELTGVLPGVGEPVSTYADTVLFAVADESLWVLTGLFQPQGRTRAFSADELRGGAAVMRID